MAWLGPQELSQSMNGSQPSLCLCLALCLSASLDLRPRLPGWPVFVLWSGFVRAISAILGLG